MPLRANHEAHQTEMLPGVWRRTLNAGDRTMLCEITIAEGAEVPDHTHPHEQIGYLVSGRMEFWLGDEHRLLQPGDSWLVPSNVPHRVRALDRVVAIDIFSPPREEYRDQ